MRSHPCSAGLGPFGHTPRLIESHYENNYGAAFTRLNAIAEELEALDPATTPPHVIRRLKQDEAAALNSLALHELYFASLGEDGRAVPELMAGGLRAILAHRSLAQRFRGAGEFASIAAQAGFLLELAAARGQARQSEHLRRQPGRRRRDHGARTRHVRARVSSGLRP